MTLRRVWRYSPNYSGRGGATPRLLVLHTAEGATTHEALGNFFAQSSSGVSSHTGIDDKRGECGEYVHRPDKAWTQGNANPVAISTELCGFASWSRSTWLNSHSNMLHNAADWLAEESAATGIPLVKLTASQAQGSGRGVCQHADLGSWGGGHWDCGSGFPIDDVLSWALGGAPPPSGTAPPSGGTAAPPFPYPSSHYLGQPDPDPSCHSGYYGGVDTTNVRTWQQRMRDRGWSITADGQYGPQSEGVARQFQAEKGLGVDGLVGPQTWAMAWTAPVT